MKKLSKILLLSVLGVFLVAGSAMATLIGVQLALPDIYSDSTGSYSYVASTDTFTSTATALTITFDGITTINIDSGSYLAKFLVDASGNFAGGVAGDDLAIYGNIDVDGVSGYEYTGLLVAGEVTNFGWIDTGTAIDLFDFTFDFTSGALSSYYALNNYKGGDIMTAEDTNFVGDWTVDHGSISTGVKHDTAPVPEPATMLLLGTGLIGLAGFTRKRFKK